MCGLIRAKFLEDVKLLLGSASTTKCNDKRGDICSLKQLLPFWDDMQIMKALPSLLLHFTILSLVAEVGVSPKAKKSSR